MKQIPLTQGKYALVDDEDFDYLNQWKWHAVEKKGKYYATRKQYRGKVGPGWKNKAGYYYETLYIHRLLLNAPAELEVDHKDGESLNNSKSNLRLCTHMQNLQNRPVRTIAVSGYKGVTWDKNLNKWFVRITANNQNIHLGYFGDRDEAARAYNQAALEHHGAFARLNKVAA